MSQMDEQMAAWMKYASPGEEHAFLKKLEGSWKARVKFWMEPGQPPQESEGTMSNELIMDGRFLVGHYRGNVPFAGEFQGMSVDGYDKLKQKYVGTWMDTMGTMMVVFEGTADGNVRTMESKYTDPMTGKPKIMKGVTTIVREDEHHYESYTTGPDGKEFKSMEIVYTR